MTITTRFHPPDGPDGSGGVLETGAGICFNGLTSDLYFPLGHHINVFQAETAWKTALCRRMVLRNRELHARNDDDDEAETHAIMQCALEKTRLLRRTYLYLFR